MIKLDEKTLEMFKNLELAQENIPGYKFTCSGWPRCKYCEKQDLKFLCLTIQEAEEHSTKYSVSMWIHKD